MARKKSAYDSEDTSEDTYTEDENTEGQPAEGEEGEEAEPTMEQIAKEQTGGSVTGPLETVQASHMAKMKDAEGKEGEEVAESAPVEASEGGVYIVDQDINIKGEGYKRGDRVSLTPEELEQVQASGVKMLPVA